MAGNKKLSILNYGRAREVAHPEPDQWSLFDFLTRASVQLGLNDQRQLARSVRAIDAFASFLGRTPVVSDLETQRIAECLVWFAPHHGAGRTTWLRNTLTRLMQLATESGVFRFYTAALSRRDILQAVKRKQTEHRVDAPHVHVRRYYREVFRPAALEGRNAKYVAQYEAAVELLCQYLRREEQMYVDHINEHHIEAFAVWAVATGYQPITITKYKMIVRRILRHARPDDFAKRPGQWARDKQPHAVPVDAEGTVWHFFQRTYVTERLLGRSAKGREVMETAIRSLCAFAGGGVRIWDLTDELLSEWGADMLARGLSPVTINGRRSQIERIWRHARRKKLVAEDPCTYRIPQRANIPDAWCLEDLSSLIAATSCQTFDHPMRNGVHVGRYFKALILTAYDTGFRRGDLLALRRSDVQANGMITIVMNKTGLPTTRAVRPATLAAISATFPPDRELIFPGLGHTRTYHKLFRRLLQVAGLPCGGRNQLQKLRRTAASHLERIQPGSASALLGHRSPQMARMHYIDPRIATTQPPLPPAPPLGEQRDLDEQQDLEGGAA